MEEHNLFLLFSSFLVIETMVEMQHILLDEILSDSDSDSSEKSGSSSTSSSNESMEDSINLISALTKIRGPIKKMPRIEGYIQNVVGNYTPDIFKQHFRVFPDTFQYLMQCLREGMRHADGPGRSQIPLEHQVLFALWFFATPDSYRSICEKFNVGKATGFRIIRRVVNNICKLAPKFIKWPTNRNDAALIWNGFREKGPIPKVIGAIDGCHIDITKPSEDGNSFINRHHRCSIQLQAVCDHKCMFTHVYIGNCGSVHDQRVLRLSELSDYLNNPDTYFPEDCHLLGDSAYTIHRHLLVPFRNNGHLTEQQMYFNNSLSSARVTIERAFGILKNRFRRILHCCPLTDLQFIPKYVLACCVLHNICLMRNDLIDVEVINADNIGIDVLNRRNNDFWAVAGRHKREMIARDIWPGEL